MRRTPAILLVLLAAIALPAAKPLPSGDSPVSPRDDSRDSWRGQAIAACVARLRAVPELGPNDLEGICGCAADRFLEGNGSAALPPVAQNALPPMMQGQTLACTARTRPDQASAVARLGISTGQTSPPPQTEVAPVEAKPADDGGTAGPQGTDRGGESGGGLGDWIRSLTLPAWLTGASLLWWIALGIFVFGLLILKVRRRDPRRDLLGPPSSMRRGAPLQPPRPPDLPR